MKSVKCVLSLVIACLMVMTVRASEVNQIIYQYQDPDITVIFSEPLNISPDRQQTIANCIAGVETDTLSGLDNPSPNNIICTIFGHDMSPEVTVTATHHKVDKYNPRCLMEVYHVTYCQRCDYTVQSLENDFYIVCCPED